MNEDTSRYLHGTEPHEQRRLSTLNDVLNDASIRELALQGGEHILDFGSGLGQLSRMMARAAGTHVVGVERSPEQIAEAFRQARDVGEGDLLDIRQGDVSAPPLGDHEWGTFDVAHARFVLEHVPDPLAVVRAMVRAVRPGGRIVLQDDDHDVLRFWPEPPGMAALWTAYIRTYDRNGNEPYVGRRLVSLLHQAGAAPVRNTLIFFGACAGQPTLPVLVENLIGVIEGVRDSILEHGLYDPGYFDDTLATFRTWAGRPDAAFWFSAAWAEGVRRGQPGS